MDRRKLLKALIGTSLVPASIILSGLKNLLQLDLLSKPKKKPYYPCLINGKFGFRDRPPDFCEKGFVSELQPKGLAYWTGQSGTFHEKQTGEKHDQ